MYELLRDHLRLELEVHFYFFFEGKNELCSSITNVIAANCFWPTF